MMNVNMYNLMELLDWNNSLENQEKGIANAMKITDLSVFLQPLDPLYNKNVWDNCAKVLFNKSDDELQPYLSSLLEWLQDLNWPGAFIIAKRLKMYKNRSALFEAKEKCIKRAEDEGDIIWIANLKEVLS